MKNALIVVTLAATSFAGAWLVGTKIGEGTRHPKPNDWIKGTNGVKKLDLLANGHIDETMSRARALMTALREADWDSRKIDRRLLYVPDQVFASAPADPDANTFGTPDPVRHPVMSDVAFVSDLYTRVSFTKVPGKEGYNTRQGFMIVGYRNGDIKKVPIEQVRLLRVDDGAMWVYPGMSVYGDDLPRAVKRWIGIDGKVHTDGSASPLLRSQKGPDRLK